MLSYICAYARAVLGQGQAAERGRERPVRARQSLGMRPPLLWTTSAALAFIFPTAARMAGAGMLMAVWRKRLL